LKIVLGEFGLDIRYGLVGALVHAGLCLGRLGLGRLPFGFAGREVRHGAG